MLWRGEADRAACSHQPLAYKNLLCPAHMLDQSCGKIAFSFRAVFQGAHQRVVCTLPLRFCGKMWKSMREEDGSVPQRTHRVFASVGLIFTGHASGRLSVSPVSSFRGGIA
jgi:hypothetical protein